MILTKHPIEAQESWQTFLERKDSGKMEKLSAEGHQRALRHHHDEDKSSAQMLALEHQKELEYFARESERTTRGESKRLRKDKKHRDKVNEVYSNPGISDKTVHGLMVS